jgi:Ca-activated chloride channel family protein
MTTNLAAASILAALTIGLQAPTNSPEQPIVRINEPREGDYVSGPIVLRAAVEPLAEAVNRLSFYADAQLVCALDKRPFECPWDAGEGVKAHEIRAVAQLASGSRLVAAIRTKALDYVETVDVDAIQVTVVVKDRKGRFVEGLSRDRFRLLDEGVQQTIGFFAAENVSLELAVAIDISASMTDSIASVKQAVKGFLGALRPGDAVTLMGFNDNFFTVARRDTDPVARGQAIDRLAPWGGTALYDAVMRSLDLLGRRQGKKALVIFSDGDDQSSAASEQEALQSIQRSDAVVYAIGQGRALRSLKYRATLQTLASASGGLAFSVSDPKELSQAFAEIVEELSHQYALGYTPTSATHDGSWRRIQVEIPKEDYRIRARQGYRRRPPAAPADR